MKVGSLVSLTAHSRIGIITHIHGYERGVNPTQFVFTYFYMSHRTDVNVYAEDVRTGYVKVLVL